MAQNNYRSYPKRYVERVGSRINHTIGNSAGSYILHTVGERETLVRCIVQLHASSFDAQSAGSFNLLIAREPKGSAVVTPATAESLANLKAKEELWEFTGSFPVTGLHQLIEVDLKGQRKLDPGDELVLRDIAANASSIGLVGTITLFLKQT